MKQQDKAIELSNEAMQRILNGVGACIFVSDPDSGRILFANEKTLPMSNGEIACLEEKGRKRAALDQAGSSSDSAAWEEQINGRSYLVTCRLIDWTDGKKALLHHLADISPLRAAMADLEKRLEQQALMTDLAQNFVSENNFDRQLRQALQMIGLTLQADRVVIAVQAEDRLEVRHLWTRADLPPAVSENLRKADSCIPFEEGSLEYETFIVKKQPYLIFNQLPPGEQLALAREYDLRAMIEAPVHVRGRFWGTLGIVGSHGAWRGHIPRPYRTQADPHVVLSGQFSPVHLIN